MINIIMPAYNAEKTIEYSINSILSQSYKDIHVLVINDGSTDSTEKVVNSIISSDSRVEMITIENSGPANARNTGIKRITDGDYTMFCDADDMFGEDFIQNMLASADNNADIVIGGFTIINSDGTENYYSEPSAVYNHNNFSEALPNLYKANLLNQPWAKLYKTSLVKQSEFPNFRWGEDRPFVFNCLMKAETISVCSYCGYRYIMRPGESLISGFYDKKPDICIYIDKKAIELCNFYNVSNDICFRYMFTKSIFSCFATMYSKNCKMTKAEKKQYVSNVLNNTYIQSRITPEGGGYATHLIYKAIKSKNTNLILALSKLANYISNSNPQYFQKIKHKK